MRIGILGGGAAGFFAAIHCKLFNDQADVVIIEKSQKLLSKVKISGGGRCNVTNVESDPVKLSRYYPRGERQLAKAFREFSTTETIRFFEDRGVPLVAQDDGCIFPKSQNSQSIIDCFMSECQRLKIDIQTGVHIDQVRQESNNSWTIASKTTQFNFDKLIICTGGLPKMEQMQWIQNLGQPMIAPYPSLFTFNMPSEAIRELMGIVAPKAITRIAASKHQGSGPLLITHWGMSGPAVLMLSAKAARELGACAYRFTCHVSWLGITQDEVVKALLITTQNAHTKKKIGGSSFQGLSTRLWQFILTKTQIDPEKTWAALSQKELNKLTTCLTQDAYEVSGKTTFKEEFVTAGGVDLKHINFKTMESKILPNLFFAGEVLDIDGLTGGFNFQAAWTTAWLAGRGAANE